MLSDSINRSKRTTFSVHTQVKSVLSFKQPCEIIFQMMTTRSIRTAFRTVTGEVLYIPGIGMISTIFYPCARHLQMGMVLTE